MPTLPTHLRRPTSSAYQGAPAPQNSEVRKVAEDALASLKYSFKVFTSLKAWIFLKVSL